MSVVSRNGVEPAKVIRIRFQGETTDINGVELYEQDCDVIYYDLNGRRVDNPTKGLYIVNGKKVLVK
jgi:hypothetical protein